MNYKFYDIILEPVITEKSTLVAELRKYVFRVLPRATKSSVKEAIQAIFNVKVNKVNIININGKVKRFKGTIGKQADRKKAIVTLSPGQTINFETGGLK